MADDWTGISRTYIDGQGFLRSVLWNQAGEASSVVGRCRHHKCPGLMVALPTHTNGPKEVWYGAYCLACGQEVAIRDGVPLLPRTSRRSMMPDGAWERRVELLDRLKQLSKREAA